MKRAWLPAWLVWAVFATAAQASPIALGASVSPQTANLAATLNYTFYAEWPDGWNVKPPRLKPEQDAFEVVGCREPILDKLPNGRHRMRATCELVLFDSGRVDLPVWPAAVSGPDGLHYGDETPALQVESIAPLVGDNPRPIKPQETIKYNWGRTLGIALGAVAALAVLVGAALLARRFAKGRGVRPDRRPAIQETPEARALRRLADRRLDEFAIRQDSEAYYTELTEIIREYLAGRFAVPALEQTTAEILQAIRRVDLKGHQRYLRELLSVADLSKFADVPAPQGRWLDDRGNARQLVVDTRPAPATPAAGATASGSPPEAAATTTEGPGT